MPDQWNIRLDEDLKIRKMLFCARCIFELDIYKNITY